MPDLKIVQDYNIEIWWADLRKPEWVLADLGFKHCSGEAGVQAIILRLWERMSKTQISFGDKVYKTFSKTRHSVDSR